MDIRSQIADLATPGAEASGLVVDDVVVSPAGKRTRVLITVDLPESEVGSANLDDVAEASRAIGKALDEANVPSTPYVLEVSTPGTDRELTEPRHFMRARTRMVEIDLQDGTRRKGRLASADGDALQINDNGEQVTLPMSDVVRGRVIVEFKRLDGAAES